MMKNKKNLVSILISVCLLCFSCEKKLGDCFTTLKLSLEKASIANTGGQVNLTTNDDSFDFAPIFINNVNEAYLEKDLKITRNRSGNNKITISNKILTVEKNGRSITIKMEKNQTKKKIVVELSLQSGNCHSEAITITQEAGN